MEGQEYLNQISASNRPAKKSGKGILSSKFFMVGVIGLVGFILILIFGAILSGGKDNEKTLSYALKLHLNNTAEVINTYQSSVKSSNLRSNSASLYSVLTSTDRELTDYLTQKYNFKDSNIDKKLVEQATLEKDGLESELFEAKINGILDRIYAHKMAYEISVLMAEEMKIVNSSKNEEFKKVLMTSYNSLENLYSDFNNFSETK